MVSAQTLQRGAMRTGCWWLPTCRVLSCRVSSRGERAPWDAAPTKAAPSNAAPSNAARWVAWAVGFVFLCGGPSIPGQAPPPTGPAPAPATDAAAELTRQLAEAVALLDRAAMTETTQGTLGVRISFYRDAWERHALGRLAAEYADGRDREAALAAVRAELALREKLAGKAAFRLTLVHPTLTEAPAHDKPQPVHFLPGAETLEFRVDGTPVRWSGWHEEQLVTASVRVGRHQTVRHGKLVPFISPLKPARPRHVFVGQQAALWGVLPQRAVLREKGRFRVDLAYEEFHGVYTNEHLINLNDESHKLTQDLSLTVDAQQPFFFPHLPPAVEELVRAAGQVAPPAE